MDKLTPRGGPNSSQAEHHHPGAGVHEQVRCDYNAWDFSPGDVALACSDGLSNYMEDELLEEYLDKYGETGNILAKELIQYAIECGGADNITAAVIYNG